MLKTSGLKIVLCCIITTVICTGQSSSARPGSIIRYAEQAKEQGKLSVTVQSPQGMHETISSLDRALSTYHVVVATPIASLTQLVDEDHVYTWYKLNINEQLITRPNPDVPAVSIPGSLLPVEPNQIVVRVPAGTMNVDGISVTVTDRALRLLTLNAKYLLFLSPDSSGKFAYLRAGSNAVFAINGNNKITPLVATQSAMQGDLDSSTGGSLDLLRETAKAKALELHAIN